MALAGTVVGFALGAALLLVVGNDLADCFRAGSAYLRQAVDWALGVRTEEPDTAIAAVAAGIRLDEARRGFLAEQGSKRLDKDDLWRLVMATMRLRLTAHSLAGMHGPAAPDGQPGPAEQRLRARAGELTGFYDQVAAEVGRPAHRHWRRAGGGLALAADTVAVADAAPAGTVGAADTGAVGPRGRGGGPGPGAPALGAPAPAAPQRAGPRHQRPGHPAGRTAPAPLVALTPLPVHPRPGPD